MILQPHNQNRFLLQKRETSCFQASFIPRTDTSDQLDQWCHDAVNASAAELLWLILINTREMVCVLGRSETETNRGIRERVGWGTAAVHVGSLVSFSWFLNSKHEHVRLKTVFFFSLSLLELFLEFHIYLLVLHLPVALSPSSLSSVSIWLSAWLTLGITPTPNTAELKQTHLATVKINHFLLFSLSLFLFLSRSLSSSPLFSHSENKLLGLYLFYVGRPDHRRVSFGPFYP